MELKYYLRGLGLGIVVTAIIMGITSSRSKAMTDDEIIERAKQLGMIEGRVLTEAASEDADKQDDGAESDGAVNPEENDHTEEEISAPEESITGENASEGNPLPDAAFGETEGMASPDDIPVMTVPDDGETGQETQTAQAETENAEDQNVPGQFAEADRLREETSGTAAVITVGSGDGSYTVSRKLEDAGAVESASEFDTFLCENGYDKKIRAGNYTIPQDASDEQIARMITGQWLE